MDLPLIYTILNVILFKKTPGKWAAISNWSQQLQCTFSPCWIQFINLFDEGIATYHNDSHAKHWIYSR